MARQQPGGASADTDGKPGDPVPLGTVLDRLLRGLGAPSAGAIHSLFDRWPEIAGPEFVDHVEPVRLDSDALVVMVADPARASLLKWREGELRKRCEELCGILPARTEIKVRPHRS